MDISSIVFWGIIIGVIGFLISAYNTLVKLRNRYENAFAQINVQLKRRYDLIPNLVETARAYLKHESETLQAVTEARNAAAGGLARAAANPGDADAIRELSRAEGALGGALGRLNIAVEAYPDLKASANMMQLTEELTSTENKVSFARQAFNDAITAYNTYRQGFPVIIVAATFGHPRDAELLEFDDQAQIEQAPKVSF